MSILCLLLYISRLTRIWFPPADICFLVNIKHALNITNRPLNRSPSRYQVEFTYLGMFAENVRELFPKFLKNRASLFPYGMNVEPYSFGTVVSVLQQNSMEGLAKPFDKYIWSFLISSSILIILFMKLTSKITGKSVVALDMIYILLEQSQKRLSQCRGLSYYVILVSTVWFLATLVISNGYKGKLFGLLAKHTYPLVPQTMQDIDNYKIFVVTTSAVIQTTENGSKILSGARMHITDIIRDVEDGKIELASLDVLRKLNDTLVFLKNTDIDTLFSAVVTESLVQAEGKGNISLPSRLIFLDIRNNVVIFGELIEFLSENVFIFGQDIDMFSVRNQWTVDRNFFLRLVGMYLQGMDESGIYSRWKFYSEIQQHFIRMTNVYRNLKLDGNGRKRNIIAHLLTKKYVKILQPPKPIGVSFFVVLAYLFLYSWIFSAVIFLLECIWKTNWWRMIINVRNKVMQAIFFRQYGFPLEYIP